jgi:selenophosphate synthetase-related protein
VLVVVRIPRPAGVALERGGGTFPSFGFLLAAPARHVAAACAAFERRGLACAPCGRFDDGHVLRLADHGTEVPVWDLAANPLTGLEPGARSPSAGA